MAVKEAVCPITQAGVVAAGVYFPPVLGLPFNEAHSTIATANSYVRGTSTTIVLTSGVKFPITPTVVRIEKGDKWCLVIYNSRSGNTLTMDDKIAYARPQNVSSGDESYTFPAGSTVEVVCSADMALQQIGYVWDNEKKLLTLTKDAIGVTQGDYGLALVNTTDAAVGAQQYSPPIRWRGEGWKPDATAASQTVDFRAFVRPIEGVAAPTGSLNFQASINGGAYTTLFELRSTGKTVIGDDWDAYAAFCMSRTKITTANRRRGLIAAADDAPYAAGVGGSIILGGKYNSSAAYTAFALIESQKANATDENYAGNLLFYTRPAGADMAERARILSDGKFGIATTAPGQIFDINDGSGNMIADGYDSHPASENIVAMDVAGMADKLKSFGLMTYTRTPFVSAGELRTATIKHFSKGRWVNAFGGEIVEDENGVETIQGDDYHGGKLRTCPDEGMLAFLDATGDKLRKERRPLPEWTRRHIAPNLHDPNTVEAMGDIVKLDDQGEVESYSLNNYVGFLHGVILELVDRVETLETA